MSGRRQDWPRFARAEIRSFAEWLDEQGWRYEGVDTKGHTLWSHPKASGRYSLPSTPRVFGVRRARADVFKLMGLRPEGKRAGKDKPKRQRQDFQLQSVQRQTRDRARPAAMKHPVRCKHCRHLHDAAAVQVVQRFKDCSTWRCPGCGVLIDDRPTSWGGSAVPVTPDRPLVRREPKRLPWEGGDAPDNYDRGIDRLMRERPHR